MSSRRSRKEIDIEEKRFLDYMDPLEFGTAKDPCFGKHFSLSAAECQVCGDAIFCANKVKLKLLSEVNNQPGLDTEFLEKEVDACTKYIKEKVEAGRPEKLIIKMAKKKFQTPTPKIKEIINQYK